MGQKTSKRVEFLLEHFMELHENGLSIPDIAKKCEIEPRTVYAKLQQIADVNNVSRESLLSRVHTVKHTPKKVSKKKKPRLNATAVIHNYETAIQETENLIHKIRTTLLEEY